MQMWLFAAIWASALVVGRAVQLRSVQTKGGEQFFSFDYSQHGQDWSSGSCSSRTRQSPIDLPAQAPVNGAFTYKYHDISEPFDIINNGHAFAADLAGLGYGGIEYRGAWYNLMNINVHSLSEHSWTGKRKPLELHLVHKHYATEALLIVAVAVESANPPPTAPRFLQVDSAAGGLRKTDKQGPKLAYSPITYTEPPTGDADFNAALQAFLKVQPPSVNMKASVPVSSDSPIDLNSFLGGGGMFYEYAGSLTAPPCAEIATWLVRKDPVKASDKQVLYLHDAVYKTTADFGNYRTLMPLADRAINLLQGSLEDPPKSPNVRGDVPGLPEQSDREFRAMKWAHDALYIARGATNYIKDLDERLRNAAQAHADALSMDMEPLGQQPLQVSGSVTLPPPPPRPPLQMEYLAKQMSGKLAEAAQEEIQDATKEISARAKAVAMQAARQAAGIVASGNGNMNYMADSVVTPSPMSYAAR